MHQRSYHLVTIALKNIVGTAVVVPELAAGGTELNAEGEGSVLLQEASPQQERKPVRESIARTRHIRCRRLVEVSPAVEGVAHHNVFMEVNVEHPHIAPDAHIVTDTNVF